MDEKTETIRIQTEGAKQTVGIHTDITFELDDNNKKNDTRKTDGKNAESGEDDSEVPIYRGTHTQGDRNHFNRRYDPNYYMNQEHVHGQTNNDDNYKYADADDGTWVRFLPMSNGGWTTERYSESIIPQSITSKI